MREVLLATRPKTLVAGFLPIALLSVYFYSRYNVFDFTIFLSLIVSTVFIQIATNFYNDYFDYVKGADVDRKGPRRFSDSQFEKKYLYFGMLVNLLTVFVSLPLVLKGGLPIVIIGIISLGFSILYTFSKFALAYNPVSEIFVILFFGLIPVWGVAYLSGVSFGVDELVLSLIFGMHSNLLLMANNLRDIKTDALVNKKTLAVTLGFDIYKYFPVLSILLLIMLDLHFVFHYELVYLLSLLPSILLLLFMKKKQVSDEAGFGGMLPVFALYYFLTTLIRGAIFWFQGF